LGSPKLRRAIPTKPCDSNPLGLLIHEGGASSVTDAAYRFARHDVEKLRALFGRLRGVGLVSLAASESGSSA
jgi:hypothetical protein